MPLELSLEFAELLKGVFLLISVYESGEFVKSTYNSALFQ